MVLLKATLKTDTATSNKYFPLKQSQTSLYSKASRRDSTINKNVFCAFGKRMKGWQPSEHKHNSTVTLCSRLENITSRKQKSGW